jgi:single-strand DNA-binding protein
MNVVVVKGVLSSPPVWRDLPSGSSAVALEVTTEDPDGSKCSVPVTMVDPRRPQDIDALTTGDEVAVIGHVRRRFFRTGSGTASRTEVVADELIRPTQRARLQKSLVRVSEVIGSAES